MNLLERTKALSTGLKELDSLRKRAERASEFERRSNDLSAPAAELANLASAVAIIKENAIPVPLLPKPLIASLYKRLLEVKKRYTADKASILDPFPEESVKVVLTQPLQQLPAKVRAAIQDGWRNWAWKRFPTIDAEVLNILGGIPALRNSVAAVRALLKEAEATSVQIPESADSVVKIEELAEQVRSTWHNLTGDGVPEPVLVFLRSACSGEGARYSDLSSSVLEWLIAHGLEGSLRVKMG